MVSFPVSCESLINVQVTVTAADPMSVPVILGLKELPAQKVFSTCIIYPDLSFLKFKGIDIA